MCVYVWKSNSGHMTPRHVNHWPRMLYLLSPIRQQIVNFLPHVDTFHGCHWLRVDRAGEGRMWGRRNLGNWASANLTTPCSSNIRPGGWHTTPSLFAIMPMILKSTSKNPMACGGRGVSCPILHLTSRSGLRRPRPLVFCPVPLCIGPTDLLTAYCVYGSGRRWSLSVFDALCVVCLSGRLPSLCTGDWRLSSVRSASCPLSARQLPCSNPNSHRRRRRGRTCCQHQMYVGSDCYDTVNAWNNAVVTYT